MKKRASKSARKATKRKAAPTKRFGKKRAHRRISKELPVSYPEKPLPSAPPAFGRSLIAQIEGKEDYQPPAVAEEKTVPKTEEPKADKAEFAKKVAASVKPPEEGLWLEVRPFVGQELRVVNFLDLVNVMSGSGQVFEFLIAAGPDPSELHGSTPFPKRVVRYFVKCPDPQTKELAKNVLQAAKFAVEERRLTFEGGKLLWHEPDLFIEYPYEAELELASHYGSKSLFPELPTYERSFEQFVDVPKNIHAAVLSGGALRFVVRRDDRAPIHVKPPSASKDGSSAGKAGSYFLDIFLRNMARGGKPDGYEEERRPPQPVDLRAQQDFMRRISQPWFTCDARAYGTQEQIRAITTALSFPSNRIKVYRLRKCSHLQQRAGLLGRIASYFSGSRVDPSLQELKGLVRLGAILAFPAFFAFLWGVGVWNPLGVLDNFFDQLLLALAFIVPLVVRAAWRMRKTIALTIGELPLLVSLPNRPEVGHFYFAEARVPVEIKEDVKAQKGASETVSGEVP